MEEGLKAGRIPRTQWPSLLQGMQDAAQAVSEVSHGRWAKLLASRSVDNLLFFTLNMRFCTHALVLRSYVMMLCCVLVGMHLGQLTECYPHLKR